jgi:hypothetical protein
MLRRHPQIFMPTAKEPRFFASDLRSPVEGRYRHRHRLQLETYLALFAPARSDQRAGEASAQYIRSRVAAQGIARLCPDARIVAILREPASFLRSFHMQMVSSKVEPETDLRAALALEPARREGKRIPRNCHSPEALLYSEHVRYVEQLRRFLAHFPTQQVLVLIYDDFLGDNDATVRTVLRFLDVDDTVAIEPIRTKPLRAVRAPRLNRVTSWVRAAERRPPAATQLSRTVNAMIPKPLHSEAFRARWRRVLYTAPPAADEAFTRELRRRFAGEVAALSEYLGRDLVALWGYDDID